ncbi:unnamed protein product [Triticum turgidum subsp. durum]|uniref:Aquaporin n=1 Tax=Triticum turgidum subsp. durum TaxID=4567 RepID=A0A9R1PWY4_TRITD|nr:unnamed protein product [Triticum turgidum subsp. durum]
MEGKEEDVRLGANKYSERQPIGTAAQGSEDKDYKEPPPAPLFEPGELKSWSFYRAGIAEFMATFLFLYVTILTVMGYSGATSKCATVGIQGIAWSFGGMIFVLVYTVFSATDAKRNARDSHVPILAPLPIGFAVFLVHLATIPITGTGINPARSLGAAIIYNREHAWSDHWIFWVGPFIGAALAAVYHQVVIRAIPFKTKS